MHSPDTLAAAITEARKVVLGYLMSPPQETDQAVRKAMKALAAELDTTPERAWRYIMTGSVQ